MPSGRKMTPKFDEKNDEGGMLAKTSWRKVVEENSTKKILKHSAIQFNKMPEPKNRQHCPTLKKTLCRTPFLAYGILWRSPCHPAAAEGAKLSKMRRGNALLAVIGVPDHL